MIQLRYLKTIWLDSITRSKAANGSPVITFAHISSHQIQRQEIDDEISASIYGADINNMLRISSPHHELETLLYGKVNLSSDNITNYAIEIDTFVYEIRSVKEKWIDLKFLCETSQNSVPVLISI